jgi:hypothetical protein
MFGVHARVIRLKRTVRQFGRPRIGALDHVTIPVHDLALARRFYCDVLGAARLLCCAGRWRNCRRNPRPFRRHSAKGRLRVPEPENPWDVLIRR